MNPVIEGVQPTPFDAPTDTGGAAALEAGQREIQRRLEERRLQREREQAEAAAGVVDAPVEPAPDPTLGNDEPLEIPTSATFETPEADQCPACGVWVSVPHAWTGFRCRSCRKGWRWASCTGCGASALVGEGYGTWRCLGCGHTTSSWWFERVPMLRHADVLAGRRRAAIAREEARLVERRRKGRRQYGAAALLAVVFVGLASVQVARNRPPADPDAPACREVAKLDEALRADDPSPSFIVARVEHLATLAGSATPPVAEAANTLANSLPPDSPGFAAAAADLAAACTAGGSDG